MNAIFILSAIFVFLTVFVESVNLLLQLKGKILSRWFGKNAFVIHAVITLAFWTVAFCFVFALQFEKHPYFHNSDFLKYVGFALMIPGLIMAVWGFKLLGLKRALCLNFFKENVPLIDHPLYYYVKNPSDYGFWLMMLGFALFSQSLYNLIIVLEFIILMIPHIYLENVPLKINNTFLFKKLS